MENMRSLKFKIDLHMDAFSKIVKINIIRTNRFHVALCLFSNRSKMTSKCGKNKEVAHLSRRRVCD